MADDTNAKTLGQAIDELISTLKVLDDETRFAAIKTACEYLKIPFESPTNDKVLVTPLNIDSENSLPFEKSKSVIKDIKTFKNEKQPKSANEMAAVAGFYLSELAPVEERKSEVDVEDLIRLFKQAGFRLPKVTRFLLSNAKNSGYFDSVGNGKYRLNPVGYNLVAHGLPKTSFVSKK